MKTDQAYSERLAHDFFNYLNFLRNEYDYDITLHRLEISNALERFYQFFEYSFHDCALCREVKRSGNAWNYCIARQEKVAQKVKYPYLLGTCYAGVSEYVFPVLDFQQNICGFLCVSGYVIDKRESVIRAKAAANKYNLNPDRLVEAIDSMSTSLPSADFLCTQIAPALHMLAMLIHLESSETSTNMNVPVSQRKLLYQKMIIEINCHYRESSLTLKNICEKLNISYSYGSHLFSTYNNQTFSSHLNTLRIETAKKYLEHSSQPITTISEIVGFNDSNYMEAVFKNYCGISATQYRKEHCRKK